MSDTRLSLSLPPHKYQIIYADPPWDYQGQLQHNGMGGRDTGGAMRHYSTVPTSEMAQWRIGDKIASKNALLFMWATNPHLDQAMELGEAWGFEWVTVAFVWNKQRANPGFYTMSECELCLLFMRGNFVAVDKLYKSQAWIAKKRTAHSAKPFEVRECIDELFPRETKIELFARKAPTQGWCVWGMEA